MCFVHKTLWIIVVIGVIVFRPYVREREYSLVEYDGDEGVLLLKKKSRTPHLESRITYRHPPASRRGDARPTNAAAGYV